MMDLFRPKNIVARFKSERKWWHLDLLNHMAFGIVLMELKPKDYLNSLFAERFPNLNLQTHENSDIGYRVTWSSHLVDSSMQ